jgi:hypothetical protein
MLFAVLAIIAFGFALLLHLVGGSVAAYWVTAELIGFICVACHLAGLGSGFPWVRQAPRP